MTIVCERSQLKRLNDAQLLQQLDVLTRKERETTLDVLRHLGEVDRRRAYAPLGYGSLFDYCTRRLGYSHSAAGRRIAAARCVRAFPEIAALLASNEVNLTTVALVAPILTAETKDEIVRSIRGKNQREVEALVARYKPAAVYRDRIRPVCVLAPKVATRPAENSASATIPADTSAPGKTAAPDADPWMSSPPDSRSGSTVLISAEKTTDLGNAPAPGRANPVETKLLIQFLTHRGFIKKYEHVRSLLSNRLKNTTFENVFGALLDEFIDRHDPDKRNARRQARGENAAPQSAARAVRPSAARPAHSRRCENGAEGLHSAHSPRPTANSGQPHSGTPGAGARDRSQVGKRLENSRHIPACVRDKIYARDKGRCAYVARDGTRCGSTHGLHMDHVVPFARGGKSTAENLRLLCARHNQAEAERLFGRAYVERYRRNE